MFSEILNEGRKKKKKNRRKENNFLKNKS